MSEQKATETKNLLQKYVDMPYARALVQLIPNFGGALDTILYEKGSKWRQQRLDFLLHDFDLKINQTTQENRELKEKIKTKIDTEEFYDLFIHATQKAINKGNKEKISRFSNILKTYLLSEQVFSEDYYVDTFIDITDELTELEIGVLSTLQNDKQSLYFSHRDKPFDLIKYSEDISKKHLHVNSDFIPAEYEISDIYLFSLTRLERMDLISQKMTKEYGGSVSVGWATEFQSTTSQLQYKKQIDICLSEFGKKYISWIR